MSTPVPVAGLNPAERVVWRAFHAWAAYRKSTVCQGDCGELVWCGAASSRGPFYCWRCWEWTLPGRRALK